MLSNGMSRSVQDGFLSIQESGKMFYYPLILQSGNVLNIFNRILVDKVHDLWFLTDHIKQNMSVFCILFLKDGNLTLHVLYFKWYNL